MRPRFTVRQAAAAASARISGTWDNACLTAFGPLGDTDSDLAEIFGCAGLSVETDSDGDFVITPPPHVTVFSAPGEGVLLGARDLSAALREAAAYLSSIHPDADLGDV